MAGQILAQWQVTIDFISRNVVESHIIFSGRFKQRISPDHITMQEWIWVNQRIVIVAFSGKVNHRVNFCHPFINHFFIGNIANHQLHPVTKQIGNVSLIPGISQFIEHNNLNIRMVTIEKMNKVGADETGTASNHKFHY